MIVVDASAVLELLLNSPRGKRVAQRISVPMVALNAPFLVDLEICQVLRRYEANNLLSSDDAQRCLIHYSQIDLQRHGHDLLSAPGLSCLCIAACFARCSRYLQSICR